MWNRDAEKQLARVLNSVEIDSRPSFPQSLKTGKAIHAVPLGVCICVGWAGQRGVRSWVVSGDSPL